MTIPKPDQATDRGNRILWGTLAAITLVVALVSCLNDSDSASAPTVVSHQPNETATLADGTQLTITDVREEWGFLGDQTVVTVLYQAGPGGHHPDPEQNTITPSRGEPVVADDSVTIGSVQGLSGPLAANVERELRIGFGVPLADLTNAQLNLDGAIFAGDFTRLIDPNR